MSVRTTDRACRIGRSSPSGVCAGGDFASIASAWRASVVLALLLVFVAAAYPVSLCSGRRPLCDRSAVAI